MEAANVANGRRIDEGKCATYSSLSLAGGPIPGIVCPDQEPHIPVGLPWAGIRLAWRSSPTRVCPSLGCPSGVESSPYSETPRGLTGHDICIPVVIGSHVSYLAQTHDPGPVILTLLTVGMSREL
jgi:hypothetical protein